MRGSRRLRLAVVALGLVLVAWLARERVLATLGSALVVDDGSAPVAVMVVSLAAPRPGALEVAKLYREGVAPRIVLCRWRDDPLDAEIRRLGVRWLPPHELVAAILRGSGVPASAIEVLDEAIDGLNSEITAIAAFAHAERPASLLYVTSRSHTRRARWLLERLVPEGTVVRVRGPELDAFRAESWWRSRDASREVAMEYLRWANTFGLRDLWQVTPPPPVAESPQ